MQNPPCSECSAQQTWVRKTGLFGPRAQSAWPRRETLMFKHHGHSFASSQTHLLGDCEPLLRRLPCHTSFISSLCLHFVLLAHPARGPSASSCPPRLTDSRSPSLTPPLPVLASRTPPLGLLSSRARAPVSLRAACISRQPRRFPRNWHRQVDPLPTSTLTQATPH